MVGGRQTNHQPSGSVSFCFPFSSQNLIPEGKEKSKQKTNENHYFFFFSTEDSLVHRRSVGSFRIVNVSGVG